VHRLNQNHAKDRSQANYAVDQGSTAYETQSFWHASSKGDTQEALVVHAETGELGNLAETDANRSTVRLVYKNFTGNTSPVTLTSTNWTNIESKTELKPGDSLQFSKSWTAFIPGIIGIILIALVQCAEMKPNAKKHIMHVAVLIGLVGFIMLAFRMLPGAISEMNWLKGETYGIIHASSLKATTMLASAGLLLVFVILCVVSFITARKEMAAQAKAEAEKKKKVLNKVKAKNEDAASDKSDKDDDKDDKKKEDGKNSDKDVKESKSKNSDDKKDSSKDDDKKDEKEKDSNNKEEAKESKKEDSSSKSTDTTKPEAKKEPAKTEKDSSEPKKKDKPPADKKPAEAPKSTTDTKEKKSVEPSKEAQSSKDSTSSSDSNSKNQDDSKVDKEAAPKSEAEDKNVEKSEPKSDSDKSNKEDSKE
jgi:hypothetical protein